MNSEYEFRKLAFAASMNVSIAIIKTGFNLGIVIAKALIELSNKIIKALFKKVLLIIKVLWLIINDHFKNVQVKKISTIKSNGNF